MIEKICKRNAQDNKKYRQWKSMILIISDRKMIRFF